ncbi:glycosyl transferase family 1 [Bacteroidia bacterium]|nr:glycosyl transferase family 1 [Bacteroidia bacterium]
MAKNNTTLIIRLSSLGDVAMTIPVVYSVAQRYPADEFVLLTKKPFQNIFINKPTNLVVIGIDTKQDSLRTVIANLTRHPLTKVADLHSVLRSWLIDFYLRLQGKKVAVINKGKWEKKKLTRCKYKQFKQLATSTERYQKVFEALGYDASLNFTTLIPHKNVHSETWIGIAPFAKHAGKIYPLEQMETVVNQLDKSPNTKLFLFGGKEDAPVLKGLAEKYANVKSVAGQLSFPEELALMNDLNVMVSMDSANMHLASLVNTPVVSVWGATHPYAGFYGYNQHPENAIQANLPCRPCSVFGNKPCKRGDYACLKDISPEQIWHRVSVFLNKSCLF